MSVGPLVTEIGLTLVIVAFLLRRYGNWNRHHIFVTLSVFVAWYFSFIIISIIPIDVSTTAYRQCLKDRAGTPSQIIPGATNASDIDNVTDFETSEIHVVEVEPCQAPWSHIPELVLPVLWRVVYWTSQCLTWIIMPMMQSYATSGNFTISGKLKNALLENAIYYGTYLVIFIILLIYVALLPNIDLDWSKLVVICITASNTWGLFLLVLLLGYSLVEMPRSCWNASKRGYMLNYLYFRAAKLSTERCENEERLEDVLEEIQQVSEQIPMSHHMRGNVDTVLAKCPDDKKNLIARHRRNPDDHSTVAGGSSITERTLVKLHKRVIKALHAHRRTQTQWQNLVDKVFHWEDVARNEMSHERVFKRTLTPQQPYSIINRVLCTPTVEWLWYCKFRSWALRALAVVLTVISATVVWSEMTFFNKSPVLSIFAVLMNKAKLDYNYAFIELLSMTTIAYLCICAYYTVFRIRVFNFYYLAPHQQTSEHSLIFAGMMLCRLTPPLCLNFLGLIHLDSHVTKDNHIVETAYTSIMGHMDVIKIISDGFNIYFPILICVLCLATYFHCGSRILHMLGFEQFLTDDEMTTDLVEEGRELVKRERTRRQRLEDQQKRNYQPRASTRPISPLSLGFTNLIRSPSEESATAGLLRDVEPIDYTEERSSRSYNERSASDIRSRHDADNNSDNFNPGYNRSQNIVSGRPPRGLFDDV